MVEKNKPLTINLSRQTSSGDRKMGLIVGIITFVFFSYHGFQQENFMNVLLHIIFILATVITILIGLNFDPLRIFGKSYLQLDQNRLLVKRNSIGQSVSIDWETVKTLKIKREQLNVTFKSGKEANLDLHFLTIQNRKTVNSALESIIAEHLTP